MTKEAKLTAAQRIVPEWKDYDNEIKNLMARVDDEQHQQHESSSMKQNNNEGRKENIQKMERIFMTLFFTAEKASSHSTDKTEL